MTQLVLTTFLSAAPPVVFRHLTEPDLLTNWIGGLKESRPLGDGVLRVGAESIEVVEERGKRIEMPSRVTAVEQDRTLSVCITYPGAGDTDMTYQLTPERSGTALRLTVVTRYRGLTRLAGPVMRPMMRRQLTADLGRLARAVETSDEPA
jgi:uncharacterized protein YndB with AHSA1/START domain